MNVTLFILCGMEQFRLVIDFDQSTSVRHYKNGKWEDFGEYDTPWALADHLESMESMAGYAAIVRNKLANAGY